MFLLNVAIQLVRQNESLSTVLAFERHVIIRDVCVIVNFPCVRSLHVHFLIALFAHQDDFHVWILEAFNIS